MLVQFRFRNYGPFRDENVFDMRAIKAYKEHSYNLMDIGDGESLLKTAAVLGANARGKSSFIDAYRTFSQIVILSANNSPEEGETVLKANYNPFLFSESEEDTEFEGVYVEGGMEYQYGFLYNSRQIRYEWLYMRNLETKRRSTILERRENSFKLGISVRKECAPFHDQIEKDVLALSYFNRLKLKTDVFKMAFYCVNSMLAISFTKEVYTELMLNNFFRECTIEEMQKRLLEFLDAVDIGIKGITIERNKEKVEVYTHHIGADGNEYKMPLNLESDGTRKMIAVYSYVTKALELNKGLMVDELNTQLHPLLQKYAIDLFHADGARGQLIYTTHDTTLLDRKYCRRDQVWFVDKKETGEAHLYSLAEFHVRNDVSYENGYLQGLYGAVPILKDFKMEENNNCGNG